MQVNRRLVTGLATSIPGVARLSERTTGGTAFSLYCYWVWLRHLVLAAESGLPTAPRVVVEFGPGDSLGTGIASLLSGAQHYYGFDVVEYANPQRNLGILEELLDLFRKRAPIPERLFGEPLLASASFPTNVLGDERLDAALAPERVEAVRAAVGVPGREEQGILCVYEPNWLRQGSGFREPADLVVSHSVLQNLADLKATYTAMHGLLSSGGYMSHEIDFGSQGFARTWDGHWTFSAKTWKLIRGRRRYAINRQPLSVHLTLIEAAGFEVVSVRRIIQQPLVKHDELDREFHSLSKIDLETRVAVIQARKRP